MIRQFPLWWFGLPSLLKGWVDRVFAMGRTYGGERIYANGVFRGKRAMLSLTTGGPQQAYLQGAFNGDISAILRPIHRGMLQFVGLMCSRRRSSMVRSVSIRRNGPKCSLHMPSA